MQQEQIDLISKTVLELIKKMALGDAEIEAETRKENSKELLVINITFQNPSLLIGQQGVNLNALQHVTRLIVRRKTDERVSFILDVNQYKSKRVEYLKSLATDVAQRVLDTDKFEVLRPMSAYERRIVHMELANNDFVSTESLGEEPNRRIVVRPVGEKVESTKELLSDAEEK